MEIEHSFSDNIKSLQNNVNNPMVYKLLKSTMETYFWSPPDLLTEMSIKKPILWITPFWRFTGHASANWIKRVKETRNETVDGKTIEKTEIKDVPQSRSYYLDWAAPAFDPNFPELKPLSESIQSRNEGKLITEVDWQGYILGKLVEGAWPGLHGGLINSIRHKIKNIWNRESVGCAESLFEPSDSDNLFERQVTSLEKDPLIPQVPYALAKEKVENWVKKDLRRSAYRPGHDIRNYDILLEVSYEDKYWLPVWIIQYQYKRDKYYAFINGFNFLPIKIMIPSSTRARLISWTLMTLFWYIPVLPVFLLFFNPNRYSTDILTIPLLFLLAFPIILSTILTLPWLFRRL